MTYAMPSCYKIVSKGRMELRNGKGPTRLQNHPKGPGNTKGLGGSILRPRRQLIAGGMAYETPRATTEAEIIALKAL